MSSLSAAASILGVTPPSSGGKSGGSSGSGISAAKSILSAATTLPKGVAGPTTMDKPLVAGATGTKGPQTKSLDQQIQDMFAKAKNTPYKAPTEATIDLTGKELFKQPPEHDYRSNYEGESPEQEKADQARLQSEMSGTAPKPEPAAVPVSEKDQTPVKDPNAIADSTPQFGYGPDTVDMISLITKTIIGLPGAIIGQETHPSPEEFSMEQIAFPNTHTGLDDTVVGQMARGMAKGFMRFWYPMTHEFANDFADAMLAGGPNGKGDAPLSLLYRKMWSSQTGKEITPEQINNLPSMKKSMLQVVGDTAQVVLAAYTPGFVGEEVAANASKGVLSSVLSGIKSSALNVGVPFGVAQVLSEGTNDPKRIADIMLANIVAMGTLGALTHAPIPMAKGLMESLTKDIIEEYKLPKNISFQADEVYKIYAGITNEGDRKALLVSLNLSAEQIRAASKSGISITIPAEKLTTIMDKPWFAKMKNAIGLKATFEQFKEGGVGPDARTGFGGYLPENASGAHEEAPSGVQGPLDETGISSAIKEAKKGMEPVETPPAAEEAAKAEKEILAEQEKSKVQTTMTGVEGRYSTGQYGEKAKNPFYVKDSETGAVVGEFKSKEEAIAYRNAVEFGKEKPGAKILKEFSTENKMVPENEPAHEPDIEGMAKRLSMTQFDSARVPILKVGDRVLTDDGRIVDVTAGNDSYTGTGAMDEHNQGYIRVGKPGTNQDRIWYAGRVAAIKGEAKYHAKIKQPEPAPKPEKVEKNEQIAEKPSEGMKQLETKIQSVTGKSMDKATPTQVQKALGEKQFIKGGDAFIQKFGLHTQGFNWSGMDIKPDLIGTVHGGALTDSFLLINDKKISKEIYKKQSEKTAKKEAKQIAKSGDKTYEEALKERLAHHAGLPKAHAETAPQWKQIMPKEASEIPARVLGYDKNYVLTRAFLTDGKDVVIVDANKLAFMKEHLPDAEMRMPNGEKLMIQFVEGDEVKGVLMAIQDKVPNAVDEALKESKTQTEKVKETVKENAKSIKDIAKETGIKEPNIRRILGMGTKKGVFERVDDGVYILNNGKEDVAFVHVADAVDALPRLVEKGTKVDMVFLDIPYNTPAVKGGNRGVDYNLISVEDFKKVMSALSKIVKNDNTPIYYMYSNAQSGLEKMMEYNQVLVDTGFKPIAAGSLQKLFKSGKPVTNVRGEVSKPEGILLLNKSGVFDEKDAERNLDFRLVRPQGYQTEKPAELLRDLILQGTKEGETVLDPFAGSGVTGAEAVKSGRKAILMEKNKGVAENITKPRVESAMADEKLPEDEDEMVTYLTKKYPDGITLYHQTSTESESKIMEEGFSGDSEDDVFFSVGSFLEDRNRSGQGGGMVKINLTPEYYGKILPDPGSGYTGSDSENIKEMFKDGFEGQDITLPVETANAVLEDMRENVSNESTSDESRSLVGKSKSLPKIETRVTKYVEENRSDLIDRYRAKHGIVYNVDALKELIPGHSENRTLSEAFHAPAAKLMGDMVRDAIEKGANKGMKAIFFAGSPGAGKTTAVTDLTDPEDLAKNTTAIMDGTLASDRSLDEIRRFLNSGHKVDVYYIDSTPEQILKNLVKRANEGGRTVPIETVFGAMQKARQNIFRSNGRYGGSPNFNIMVVDNRQIGNPQFVLDGLDYLKTRQYSDKDIATFKENAYAELDNLYEQGKINKEIYDGFTRRRGEEVGKPQGGGAVRSFAGEESQVESRQGSKNGIAQKSVSGETPSSHTEATRIQRAPINGTPDQQGAISEFQRQNPKLYPDTGHIIAPEETAAKGDNSLTLNAEIIPGISKAITEDLIPGVKATAGGLSNIFKEVAAAFNPAGQAPSEAVDVMMVRKGEFEQYMFRIERASREMKKMWDRQPEKARLDFMSKIERGEEIQPAFKAIADFYRQRLNSAHAEVAKYKSINFIQNFFPHFWKNPEKAEKHLIPGLIARRPLQGPRTFLKERVFDSIEEGIKAGYTPVSTNPEELLQLYEQNVKKFIMAQKIKEDYVAKGLWKFVVTGGDRPEGWTNIDDGIARIYYKESKTLKEFFDEHLMASLNKFAADMNIKHTRVMGGIRGKHEAAGVSLKGKSEVKTVFGTPESVLIHEIGHQLDERYGLKEMLVNNPEYKQELRALADKRMGNIDQSQISASNKAYIRKGEEKMAVMFEAYLHAPDIFKSVAPKTYRWFTGFMGSRPELRPILDLKPSLVLGMNKKVLEGPMVKGGEYYAPVSVARLVNNYLSRDFIYETALGRGLMNVKNTMNAFQLGLSAFHLSMETIDTVVTQFSVGLSKIASGDFLSGFVKMAKSPVAPYSFFRDGQKFYNGDQELMKIESDLFTGGASLRQRQYYKNTVFDTFVKNVREGNLLGAAFRAPLATIEGLMRPLFSYYIPRLKVGAFRELFAAELERSYNKKLMASGALSRASLARSVWNNIENRMGELNYDNLFWNRNLKTTAMLTFRAVGWNLGTLREIGGAFIQDMPKEAYKAFKGKGFNFTPKMSYTMSLFFVMGVIGSIYGYLHTGSLPSSLLDLFYPKNGTKNPQGEDTRVQFPSYLKDLWQASHNPIKMIGDKFAPEFTALISLITNKDFYGDYIRNTNDNLPTQAKQVGLFLLSQFTPFTFANINQQNKGQAGTEQRIESFFGIMNAPRAVTQTEWESYLQVLYTGQMGASGPQTPQERAAAQKKSDVRRQIQNGDTSGVQQLVNEGIISAEGAKKFIADSKLTTDQRMYQNLSKQNKAIFEAQFPKVPGLEVDKNGKPKFTNGTTTDSKSIIDTVWTYAKAVGTDPITAFSYIFEGQSIRDVRNGTIIVNRMSLADSQGIKKAANAKGKELILDHIVPLEAGGDNSKDNLQIIPNGQWAGNTPIEDFLGKELAEGRMTGKQAREFAIRYKAGMKEPLSDALMKEYINKYGSKPISAQEIYNYQSAP